MTEFDKDGKIVFTKVCFWCKQEYKTTSRRQKFCSQECCAKYHKRSKNRKSNYDSTKIFQRLHARSHSLGRQVLEELAELNIRPKVCSCGATENLSCHHKDLNWLNNTPSNLEWVCESCHKKAHSDLEFSLKEKGISIEQYYEESCKPLFIPLLRK